jgi:hypothetical protein
MFTQVLGMMTLLIVTTKHKHFLQKMCFFQNYYLTIYPMFLRVSLVKELCAQNKVTAKGKTSSEERDDSNDTSNAGSTTWVKEDKTPNLGSFTGIQG